MKEKILVILVCMLMITSTTILITQENLRVKATDGGNPLGDENNVGLNSTYIHSIVENLSQIVFTYPKGRSFGTPGELYAKNRTIYWMNQINLYNVHTEEINGTDQNPNLNKTLEIISMGIQINGTQNITDFHITPRWNTTFLSLILPQLFT
jgi:hypothetical protein